MSETGYQFPNSSTIPTFEEALADTSFYADHLSQSQQLQHSYQGNLCQTNKFQFIQVNLTHQVDPKSTEQVR